jgi:hypothetical protein
MEPPDPPLAGKRVVFVTTWLYDMESPASNQHQGAIAPKLTSRSPMIRINDGRLSNPKPPAGPCRGARIIASKKKTSLKRLFSRLQFGALVSLIGSWVLAASRLTWVQDRLGLADYEIAGFTLDFIALTAIFFGLLVVLFVLPGFRARLDRLESLGEHDW